jgi:L-arabinokinase
VLVWYISGHGFGHAARDVEVVNRLGASHPGISIVLRTSAPRWIFDLTLTQPIDWQPLETDTGVIQIDSLRVDESETIRSASRFYDGFDERAAREAEWLQSRGARLVVGDIPPLAFAAASIAGIPAIALGNFTWDWIYEGYRDWIPDDGRFLDRIRAAYSTAALALRLPMHGGFEMFRAMVDLPFIARQSQRDPLDIRRALELPLDAPLVLLSFGGYGLARIDFGRIASLRDYLVVTTADVGANRRADQPHTLDLTQGRTGESAHVALPGNARLVDEQQLYANGLRYEDVVAAVDVVITKPGYGIISECVANHTALVYTSRGHFVEYDVLVREMPRWLRSGFISNDDLFAGNWQDALDGVLALPEAPDKADVNGAAHAASIIASHM